MSSAFRLPLVSEKIIHYIYIETSIGQGVVDNIRSMLPENIWFEALEENLYCLIGRTNDYYFNENNICYCAKHKTREGSETLDLTLHIDSYYYTFSNSSRIFRLERLRRGVQA